MKNWFKNLSPVLQITIVIVALFLIWQIFRMGKNFLKNTSKKIDQYQETNQLEAQGQTLTYTNSQYVAFADKLQQAMDTFGTDEEAIFSVFKKMQNDLDILELDKKFGVRKGTYEAWNGANLTTWLNSELSSSDITTLNNILSSKGINKSY